MISDDLAAQNSFHKSVLGGEHQTSITEMTGENRLTLLFYVGSPGEAYVYHGLKIHHLLAELVQCGVKVVVVGDARDIEIWKKNVDWDIAYQIRSTGGKLSTSSKNSPKGKTSEWKVPKAKSTEWKIKTRVRDRLSSSAGEKKEGHVSPNRTPRSRSPSLSPAPPPVSPGSISIPPPPPNSSPPRSRSSSKSPTPSSRQKLSKTSPSPSRSPGDDSIRQLTPPQTPFADIEIVPYLQVVTPTAGIILDFTTPDQQSLVCTSSSEPCLTEEKFSPKIGRIERLASSAPTSRHLNSAIMSASSSSPNLNRANKSTPRIGIDEAISDTGFDDIMISWQTATQIEGLINTNNNKSIPTVRIGPLDSQLTESDNSKHTLMNIQFVHPELGCLYESKKDSKDGDYVNLIRYKLNQFQDTRNSIWDPNFLELKRWAIPSRKSAMVFFFLYFLYFLLFQAFKIREIQKRILNCPDLVKPQRSYVSQLQCRVSTSRKSWLSHGETSQIFIFSDSLVICDLKKKTGLFLIFYQIVII